MVDLDRLDSTASRGQVFQSQTPRLMVLVLLLVFIASILFFVQ